MIEKSIRLSLICFLILFVAANVTFSKVLFSEDFDTCSVSTFPGSEGWNLLYSGAGKSQQYIDDSKSASEPHSFHLAAGSYCNAATATHPLDISSDNVSFEINVFLEELVSCGCSPYLMQVGLDKNYGYVTFECDGNVYSRNNGNKTLLTSFDASKWYNVRIVCNFSSSSFDVYINDIKYGSNFKVSKEGWPAFVYVSAGHGDRPEAWFDDLLISTYEPNLTDVTKSLQVICGYSPEGVQLLYDLNSDGKIGLVEAIHSLQEMNFAITAPGPPIIGTVMPGNTEVSVNFAPPDNDGGSVITGYVVTSEPGGITATGIESPIIVKGLNNGTAYTFTVKAINNAGTGFVSKSSNSVIPATVPGTPIIGVATPGNTEVSVSFTPPNHDGGSAITGYTVVSEPGGIIQTGTESPITVNGLTNGVAYTFIVRAFNAVGNGFFSAASNSVTPEGSSLISSCFISLADLKYQDSAGRNINYDFSSGQIIKETSYFDGAEYIDIPKQFITGRGSEEAATSFLWGEIPHSKETDPILKSGSLFIAIDKAEQTGESVGGVWAMGANCSQPLCADLSDGPLDWSFEVRIKDFSGTDLENHSLELDVGAGTADIDFTGFNPSVYVVWFKGWHEGIYYDNVLILGANVEDDSTNTEIESDEIILLGQDPAATILDIKLTVSSGTTFIAQYKLNDGPWQKIWQHTINRGNMPGFPDLKPYVSISNEKF